MPGVTGSRIFGLVACLIAIVVWFVTAKSIAGEARRLGGGSTTSSVTFWVVRGLAVLIAVSGVLQLVH
jgi:hypothetical protein